MRLVALALLLLAACDRPLVDIVDVAAKDGGMITCAAVEVRCIETACPHGFTVLRQTDYANGTDTVRCNP